MQRISCLFLTIFLLLMGPVLAKPLISDVSEQNIRIDTNFTGTNVLLFGARNDAGDIVVTVRGPKHNYVVHRKKRVLGIWVNRQKYVFEGVDSFYAIAASRPLSVIDNDQLLHSLGFTTSEEPFIETDGSSRHEAFKDALLHYKQRHNLFVRVVKHVPLTGQILFKIIIRFPENIPPGVYTAETYLFNNAQLVAMQSTPITVQKVGFDAFVSSFAKNYPVFYGLTAIGLALGVGWVAGIAFRKI